MTHPYICIQTQKPSNKCYVICFDVNYGPSSAFYPYDLRTMIPSPKMNLQIKPLLIGDGAAIWHKVNNVEDAEDIILNKYTEQKVLDFRLKGALHPFYDITCELRIACSAIAMSTRRGHGNVVLMNQSTLSKIFNDITADRIGHGIDLIIENKIPDNIVHVFFKGKNNEFDGGFYLIKDDDQQLWLCVPNIISPLNKTKPHWETYRQTLDFTNFSH